MRTLKELNEFYHVNSAYTALRKESNNKQSEGSTVDLINNNNNNNNINISLQRLFITCYKGLSLKLEFCIMRFLLRGLSPHNSSRQYTYSKLILK